MSKRRAATFAAAVLVVVGLAVAGSIVQMRAALAAAVPIRISSRTRTVSGRAEGEVLVGSDVVIRIRSAAGGLTAGQRASRVATRLQQLAQAGRLDPNNLRVAVVNGEHAVMLGNEVLITADNQQAALNGVTPERLATIWRDNLQAAISQQVAGYRAEEERAVSKIVPIVSLGSGIRVGAAQIAGPATQVSQASVVGQIEATFQDIARIRIFVPLQGVTDIRRVPQVNVRAYGDIRL